MTTLASARVLVVGVGGLGCPVALALAEAGVGTLALVDDDRVEIPNLHRQILFGDRDRGERKVDAAAKALHARVPGITIETHDARLLPENAVALVAGYDLVVEGSDNYPTKFLAADACAIANKPVVHGAAVGLHGTVLGVAAEGRPCYRCLFEDVPPGPAASCETAGVLGPLVGLTGAIQAHVALRLLGGAGAGGTLFTVDGARLAVRERTLTARARCTLCASDRLPSLERSRYTAPSCDAR